MIVVSPLSGIAAAASRWTPRTMLTLMSTSEPVEPPPCVETHMALTFNDVVDVAAAARGLRPPASEHVAAIIDLARDAERPLLIHCWFGVSRSPAAALIAAAALQPQRSERELTDELRALAPYATPNARMIALADEALGRGGRLAEAVAAIGRGAETAEGVPFAWDIGA